MIKYLYTITGFDDRPGFGITSNIDSRARQYSSHQGRIVVLPFVWAGPPPQINALEKVLKRDKENLFLIESDSGTWETEWMGDDWNIDKLEVQIQNIIADRFPLVKLIYTDYDFSA